jgi:hypothetical protein
MSDKVQLVVTALQQRIGEIVSNYETQIAILRADYTNALEELNKKEKESDDKLEAKEAYSEHLNDLETD